MIKNIKWYYYEKTFPFEHIDARNYGVNAAAKYKGSIRWNARNFFWDLQFFRKAFLYFI